MSLNKNFDCRCHTKKGKLRGRFVWKIEEFQQTTELLKSPVFPSSSPENLGKWCVWLYPTGSNNCGHNGSNIYGHNGSNNVNSYGLHDSIHMNSYGRNGSSSVNIYNKQHISIVIHQEAKIEIWAKLKFSLINDKGSVAKSEVTQYKKFTHKTCTEVENFVERDYVLNKVNCVLPNDELTILCEIEIRRSSENHYLEFVPTKLNRPLCRLAEDMSNLLSSESLTDLTITVGERQFRAHKAILAARSPVFAAMFHNEMVEKKSSPVKITDIDPDVFQEMLEYIYTGDKVSQANKAKELLAAANKYELKRLKFTCEDALCKVLNVSNILESIALADLYNAHFLKEYSLSFVMKNSSEIVGSPAWDIFKHSHQSLSIEILEKICLLK